MANNARMDAHKSLQKLIEEYGLLEYRGTIYPEMIEEALKELEESGINSDVVYIVNRLVRCILNEALAMDPNIPAFRLVQLAADKIRANHKQG